MGIVVASHYGYLLQIALPKLNANPRLKALNPSLKALSPKPPKRRHPSFEALNPQP